MTVRTWRVQIALLTFAAVVAVAAVSLAGGIKITVQRNKDYQYENRRTWAWDPKEPGTVRVLQAMGDPEKIKAGMEPMIVPAVEQGLAKRGFTQVSADKADFHVCYYLLVGPNYTAQTHGQFIGAVPAWGLPDFVQSTSSLKVIDQGSLVVDVTSTELKMVIWRGVAAAEINGRLSGAERQARIEKGVADMLKNFPPKDEKAKGGK
jgi:hypothetical protein